MSEFTRGFRLHQRRGTPLDGAAFPSGRVFVLDDPEWGLATAAASVEDLQRGYPDARIEWADDSEPLDEKPAEMAPLAHQDAEQQASDSTGADEPVPAQPQQSTLRDRAAAAIYEWNNPGYAWATAHPDDLIAYRGDADAVMDVLPEQQGPSPTGLPAEQPCADPRHTGAIREQLGCSGPDPATT